MDNAPQLPPELSARIQRIKEIMDRDPAVAREIEAMLDAILAKRAGRYPSRHTDR